MFLLRIREINVCEGHVGTYTVLMYPPLSFFSFGGKSFPSHSPFLLHLSCYFSPHDGDRKFCPVIVSPTIVSRGEKTSTNGLSGPFSYLVLKKTQYCQARVGRYFRGIKFKNDIDHSLTLRAQTKEKRGELLNSAPPIPPRSLLYFLLLFFFFPRYSAKLGSAMEEEVETTTGQAGRKQGWFTLLKNPGS